MCFSATASFSAGLGLTICGIAALMRAKQDRLKMIAVVPLIFGLQQIAEGFVWLSFINPDLASIRTIASYIFVSCAGIVWPLWMPLAIARFEGSTHLKRYLPSLIAGGLFALSFIALMCLYPLTVTADCNVIYYFDFTQAQYLSWGVYYNAITSLLYVIATIVPFFITRNRSLWFIGVLISIAYAAAWIVYTKAFASVWCFFAALISILVYGFIIDESRK